MNEDRERQVGEILSDLEGLRKALQDDPDLAGWTPGTPQEVVDAVSIVYTALSQFMNKLAPIFRGTVLGLKNDGSAVVARFPDGRIWEFGASPTMAAMFVSTEVIGVDSLGQAGK